MHINININIYIYIYYIYIYIFIYIHIIYIGEDQEFIIHVFYWCISLDHKSITNVKKTSNLIKGISSHNICSEMKPQQVKKTI